MENDSHQYEAEQLLSDSLSYGDKSRLAAELGVSLSEISQQCNPAEPRKSDFFKFRRFLAALSPINNAAAQLLLCDLHALVNRSVGRVRDLSQSTAAIAQETAEFIAARVTNKPLHIQRKECLDIIAAASGFLARLGATVRKGSVMAQQKVGALPLRRNTRRLVNEKGISMALKGTKV